MQSILIFPVCLLLQHADRAFRAQSVPADKHGLLMQSEEPGSDGNIIQRVLVSFTNGKGQKRAAGTAEHKSELR